MQPTIEEDRNMEELAQSWEFLERELENFQQICREMEKEIPAPTQQSQDLPTTAATSRITSNGGAVPKKQPPPPPPTKKPKPALLPKPKVDLSAIAAASSSSASSSISSPLSSSSSSNGMSPGFKPAVPPKPAFVQTNL